MIINRYDWDKAMELRKWKKQNETSSFMKF